MKKVPQEKKQHFFTSKHLDFLHYSLTYYFWLYSLLASFLSLCISFCYYAKVLQTYRNEEYYHTRCFYQATLFCRRFDLKQQSSSTQASLFHLIQCFCATFVLTFFSKLAHNIISTLQSCFDRLLSKHFCLKPLFSQRLGFFTVCTKMHFRHTFWL